MKSYLLKSILCVGVALSVAALMHAPFADTPAPSVPNHLPGPPAGPDQDDQKNFKLRDFVAKDATGKPIDGVPANLIDMFSGMLEWDNVGAESVKPFGLRIPADLRNQVQLFFADNDAGWMIVPRGWKVWQAALGADGTTRFVFVAPSGPQDGWMITGEVPGCFGCMYSDADGILPAAHEVLVNAGFADEGTKSAELIPAPDAMKHPNDCTAVFTYRQPKSPPVKAVLFLGSKVDNAEATELSIFIALPADRAALSDYIVSNFQKANSSCALPPVSFHD